MRRVESGVAVAEVCRDVGSTDTTFYRWKRKFGGLGMPEFRELRQLRGEDRGLTPVVADRSLDCTMLQETLRHGSKTVLSAIARTC